ncbi:unnamed protein product, partial [Rotaria socialis]
MNRPEWTIILVGCVACLTSGALQSIGIVLLIEMVNFTAFAVAGSKLTQRVRSKAFTCLLRQEVAYFDEPENSSGALCARLSSDAMALQEMSGTRLSIIVETFSMLAFGISLGFYFSWHLTLIVCVVLPIIIAGCVLDIYLQMKVSDATGLALQCASSVDFRGEIEFDQVKFIYPSRPKTSILNNLQLTIKSGQRVALVGPSGCGKSTIAQLIERFYDVTRGQLHLDGIDIRQLNIKWIRSRLGLVSQEPVLFGMTIAKNIAYGKENISMEEIMDAANKANIHSFIQQLPEGYETNVGRKGSQMSGGEKQRIAIARILVRRPKVLILDEATSAMDSYNEQVVQEALERAQDEDPSRTSVIIAHRLSTIRSCDVICVIGKGRVMESGTHAELIQQRGVYYQ